LLSAWLTQTENRSRRSKQKEGKVNEKGARHAAKTRDLNAPKEDRHESAIFRSSIGGGLPPSPELNAHVRREFAVVVDNKRKYVQVSDSFCKLLGYQRDELIGRTYDEVTAPGTNDIPTISSLLNKVNYMHGIWVFAHRHHTRIFVRYEAWIRPDGLTECNMDLLGAGA
jgi:PAS domain-containing protein